MFHSTSHFRWGGRSWLRCSLMVIAATVGWSCELSMMPALYGEEADAEAVPVLPIWPVGDDYTAASLRACQDGLRNLYGGQDRDVPLEVKAAFFEWVLRRYHFAPHRQAHHTVSLPDEPGEPPTYLFGDDVTTWNGALLAALSYKYAVTRDPETLELIGRLLKGFHFVIEVTGQPGLAARCVVPSDVPVRTAVHRYEAADGTVYHYRSDAAKGTYNQLVGGYAVMRMLAFDDLPRDKQELARRDLSALVAHVIGHGYRLTERDGRRTKYGDLRPLVGITPVPFNAQVAYMIVSAGHHFPADGEVRQVQFAEQFQRLRHKYQVYYERPFAGLVRPQQVGASPFVKGMNDRNHVLNAAYVGLMLEIDAARRQGRPPDGKFLYRLGQTMYWTMESIQYERNSLCNFMWAGLLNDPAVFAHVIPRDHQRTRQQLAYVVATGFEQLRRAPLDRFEYPGRRVDTRDPQWVDAQLPQESYYWKTGPFYRWEITGPPTNSVGCAIDYLHAYWLMRYFRLDGR